MRVLMNIRILLLAFVAALALAVPAAAQTFPALSGRVVDDAGVLDAGARAMLTSKLKELEEKTSDQVVVATVKSLQGLSVEVYANRLFRAWQLGQKDKNNGVLFLIAPADRKVRIEVGYGLEGAMPDAVAKLIIEEELVARFRANQFDSAASAGVDAIIEVLTGDAPQWKRRALTSRSHASSSEPHVIELPPVLNVLAVGLFGGLFLTFFVGMGWIVLGSLVSTLVMWGLLPKKADRHGLWRVLDPFDDGRRRTTGSGRSESAWASSSDSSSSESFSGGGGSSGGGGASGSW
jgi:uncharacterized protein